MAFSKTTNLASLEPTVGLCGDLALLWPLSPVGWWSLFCVAVCDPEGCEFGDQPLTSDNEEFRIMN